jgi:gliding motility-associated-like protein
MLEFANPAPCEPLLTLDCDDNMVEYSCLDTDGVLISDSDIVLFADADLTEMTITIAPPVVDAPFEILTYTGAIPNINEAGSGSSMITFTNGGGATIQDFKDALQLIVYQNLATPPTPGLRSIDVQFTTASGAQSNVSIYYVDVMYIAQLDVDLGADHEICDGLLVTLDAGHPGALYEWSTGEQTQEIEVAASGEYIVTVSDGVNCPGMDTVLVDVIPNIAVSLGGDSYICDNQSANLFLTTDTPFALDIEVQADPGSPFFFSGVTGTFAFTDLPSGPTTYTITNVTSAQSFCLVMTDSVQIIDVYPAYNLQVDTALCDGDSIWLGFYWEFEAGTYENLLETFEGCDSMVTTTISIMPAVHLFYASSTCDVSEAGVFYTYLPNANGCDTVVETTITLLPLDTTHSSSSTCAASQAGVFEEVFVGSDACDSIVVTTVSYEPPADTTFLQEETCDSAQLDITQYIATGMDGCDSLIVRTVTLSPADTTRLYGISCDSASMGVFQTLLSTSEGCDSLIIHTVSAGIPDTTSLFTTSCDSSSLGIFINHYTNIQLCDSTVITMVSYSERDSVFLTSATCDITGVGVFVTTHINQFGCDSIVTETVSLLPSDATTLSSTTCDPSAAGIFTLMLTNQYGCDSIVTETVTLLPSDQTTLASTTCIASQAGIFISTQTNQYGCDSIITETITLIPGDTTYLWAESCDPSEIGINYYVAVGSDGCDSLVIETTTLYPLPVLQVQSVIDYNGFDISCAGDADGSAIANVSGVEPFTYLWSTTETDPLITGLSAGDYAVSVTDGNGCMTNGVITLTEPEIFMIGFEVSEPDCFDQQLGHITVKPNEGVPPYVYSIDGTVFQSSPDFTGLSEGLYQITSLDANDCSATEIISIDIPLMVQVELGDNQVISLGDSSLLQAIVNLPFDSLSAVLWTGIDSIGCPNCLTQIVAPIITTAYTVSVTSTDGCADRDSMIVTVTTDQKIFVPNIFSPNGDGVNDVLSISIGEDVEEISSFSIFDRWGTLVFGVEHVLPNDPAISWDGKLNGERVNPGVFTFKLVVVFSNGEREVRYGDITLLR